MSLIPRSTGMHTCRKSVSGFLSGERNYSNLKGDTGPLVYPAGFLYIYSGVKFLTGGNVFSAQILFGILYIINLAIVMFIYVKTDLLPWWALSLLCLSKRLHSIFVLRLFNDCFAMTLLNTSVALLIYQKWHLGLIIFSAAVSIKMNVLLYAPPLLLLMLKAMDIVGVISALAGAALVQVLLGLPFLLEYPVAYISNAFNLGRVFVHFWSVNFKFIPEPVFVSKEFAVSLLITHLMLLALFAHYKWCKHEGGLLVFLNSTFALSNLRMTLSKLLSFQHFCSQQFIVNVLNKEHIVSTMFVGNFIGILCARSLHYQFYSWYFFSLPFLLWRTPFPTLLRLVLFFGVELCWNVFPSNLYSSLLLLFLNLFILWGIWCSSPEYPYVKDDNKSLTKQKKRI
ncbi:dol-P-Man:Man(5)GlcNAc(2)-PP-Dol alpha-1,3-mannosyltransferase isoform X2 [Impatiens glandulifera]|uniref:dol-P-Man:Man(5)GlcNAc(2)-PP-Dol alpha-1,3-mannosyltransferase isoform X2 n=1 Tax=Impatiens glandulifera TaxID=253017 RepID=UPI001FB0D4C4|nr:dol-P-Man:Man(5)GlcNAc(2)-PP-Dol alpha-1,3-mannosyltransferase isoform X2 [Impatiens glandulifera]